MKKQINLLKLFFVAVIFFTVFGACNKEEVAPEPVDLRDKYIGSYSMKEECGSDDDEYTISISKKGSGNEVEIFNVYNAGKKSKAFVSNSDQLNIIDTTIGMLGNCSVLIKNGSGMIDGRKLTIIFDIGSKTYPEFGCDPFSFSCIAVGNR